MSSLRPSSSEEKLLCSICLEVFSEPVSTPCGHNFCKRCISQTWDTDLCCKCPLCNRSYTTRPELWVNTLLCEMVSELSLEKSSRSTDMSEVLCDACSEPKLKALKSCLVCLSSFCESHLQPHLSAPSLKKHQLMEPLENLEDMLCPTHQRPLELFCSTDQSSVCLMCSVQEHKNHELLSLEEACERSRESLPLSQEQSQHMAEQRRLKAQEIQHCLKLSETENQKEEASGMQAFTALIESAQRHRDQFLEELQEKQRNNQKQACELLHQLQQETCELERKISLSTHPLHLLQRCAALPPAGLKDWSSVSFEPQTCEGSAARALSELETSLSQEFNKVFKHLPEKNQLRRVQTFAVDVTLDPDTAHPKLALSEDLKQVHHTDVWKKLPDSPQRFDAAVCVLGKQSFSSGKFYFEVQVKGSMEWDLGVTREFMSRKGLVNMTPQNGYWCIWLRNQMYEDCYVAGMNPPIQLPLQRCPQKVGVFVDYGARLVSFYDADSADLIHSFTGCCFSDKLIPFFSPSRFKKGTDSAPLIICSVETDSGGN